MKEKSKETTIYFFLNCSHLQNMPSIAKSITLMLNKYSMHAFKIYKKCDASFSFACRQIDSKSR